MTSSPDTRQNVDRLPPGLSSMWRLCKLGYRHERGLLLAAFSLALLSALPDSLLALWFKLLGDGALARNWSLVVFAAVALGVSSTATWFLQTVSTRVQRRFRDKVTIALESHVATLLASIATIAHQERPEYLDRLAVLRNQVFMLDHMYMSLFTTCAWVLRLVVTVGLLVSIHPALVLLLLCALPTVLTSAWRPAVERNAFERGAQANRLARHLFDIATTAPRGKKSALPESAPPDQRAQARMGVQQPAHLRRPMAYCRVAHGRVGRVRCRLRGRDCLRRCTALARPREMCFLRSLRARACRSTSGRPLERSASFVGCGWMRRSGLRGSRTMPAHWWQMPISRRPRGSVRAFVSSTCRLSIRAPTASCSTM